MSTPRVLVVAGSDPLGYSGLQADLRHLGALGVLGSGIPSCFTEQSAEGVHGVLSLPPGHLERCLDLAIAEGFDAVKLGLLHSPEIVRTVMSRLRGCGKAIVLDPVLANGSGVPLVTEGFSEALRSELRGVTLITPNLPEARELSGFDRPAGGAAQLRNLGARQVLLKGGHGEGDTVVDRYFAPRVTREWREPRIPEARVRGTGCALSTVIAALLARGEEMEPAILEARRRVRDGIRRAVEDGRRALVLD